MRDPSVPAADDLDELCLVHDGEYADCENDQCLLDADIAFAKGAYKKGWKGALAASLVGSQAALRSVGIMAKSRQSRGVRGAKKTLAVAPKGGSNTTNRGNDVVVSAPVARATRRTGTAPMIQQKQDSIVVRHRSLIKNVTGTSTFSVTGIAANPGLAAGFPWLAKLASKYDQYRFKKLIYDFRSVCSTSTAGVVMLSFDYDALDAAPASKSDQAQTIPNAENNAWVNNRLVVPVDNLFRFTRQGTVAASDLKTYDLGNLWVSTAYGTGSDTWGELYVEYEVELKRPSQGVEQTWAGTSANMLNTSNPFTNLVETGTAQPCYRTSGSTLLFTSAGEYLFSASIVTSADSSITSVPDPTVNNNGSIKRVQYAATAGRSAVAAWAIRVTAGTTLTYSITVVSANVQGLVYTVLPCEYAALPTT